MFDIWKDELTEDQTDALLDKMTGEIGKRRLHVPAILLFEMHKPLSYVGANAGVALAPFLVPFVGFDAVNDYTRLFSKRENVDKLLARLEQHARQPSPEGSCKN